MKLFTLICAVIVCLCASPLWAEGEVGLFQANCLNCHGAKLTCTLLGMTSQEEWEKIIGNMIKKGSKLEPEQAKSLSAFLSVQKPESPELCQ